MEDIRGQHLANQTQIKTLDKLILLLVHESGKMFWVSIENEVFCLSIGEIVGEWKLLGCKIFS